MGTVPLLILLLLLTVPFLAAADAFCDNVKSIAPTLPQKTTSSPLHFATATIGQTPDTVYALALCRGDILDDYTCAECVASTFDKMIRRRPSPQRECYKAAYYYYDNCTLIYSSKDILAASPNNTGIDGNVAPTFERWNTKNDPRFIAGARIQELLVKTVEEAAANTQPMRFATAVMDTGAISPKMYSLAQCTPDLSRGDCLACLSNLLSMVNFGIYLSIGGQMGAIRCFFRYEASWFYDSKPMLFIGQPSVSAPATTKHKSKLWVIPVVILPLAATSILWVIYYSRRLARQNKGKVMRLQGSQHVQNLEGEEHLVWEGKNSDFSVFDFEQLMEATNNFSEESKLGQGGFGAVHKGRLPEGLDIAVKRLASHSGQGFVEFKNEVQLIAKFQHRNLVRLLGCCSQEEEKILVYEYLPNKSLDFFIFDPSKRASLDWSKQVAIIEGVAHGLLYLHKHSRLLVIHRDLKPNNILLDNEMNPKISDFGLAKIFCSDDTEGNTTRRVVGTYGYMAPEYASQGHFSIKSDVFSFGVLVLEILSGKRNFGNQQCGAYINLLAYAWKLFKAGRWIELTDEPLFPNIHSAEMMRCINIALLCVQENSVDRPTMLDVATMLSSKTTVLSEPKQPAYFNLSVGNEEQFVATQTCSVNNMTISIITGR